MTLLQNSPTIIQTNKIVLQFPCLNHCKMLTKELTKANLYHVNDAIEVLAIVVILQSV